LFETRSGWWLGGGGSQPQADDRAENCGAGGGREKPGERVRICGCREKRPGLGPGVLSGSGSDELVARVLHRSDRKRRGQDAGPAPEGEAQGWLARGPDQNTIGCALSGGDGACRRRAEAESGGGACTGAGGGALGARNLSPSRYSGGRSVGQIRR